VGFLIVIVLLFAVMWLLVIRPQKRRQLQQTQLLQTLSVGDEVLTAGGIYGIVRSVDEEQLLLEIAPGTQVRVARRAIAGKVDADEPEAAEELDEAAAEPLHVEEPAAEETTSAEANRR
jgi:preprotein translocase subunit YajC